ncbi:MAG: carbohydrate ABC transporter permease [Thaumarchaeota archaeon]|nr:carbohydrate ABC transporter permease [Nitrososphaerota archaeon]
MSSNREQQEVRQARQAGGGQKKRRGRKLLLYLGFLLATLYTLYPPIAMGLDGADANIAALFAGNNPVLIAGVPFPQGLFTFTPIHYLDALSLFAFPARVLNSLIIAGLSVGIALAVGIPVSYILARVDIKGKGVISFVLLALRTVSPFAVVIPLYIFFSRIGLWDTYPGVALAELLLVLTVVVWMVKGFFAEIPPQIYDAATVFAASEGQIFRRVALPIVAGGILITALFGFVLIWNEFLISVILTGPTTKSVAVGVWTGLGEGNRTPDFVDLEAAATLAYIPALIVMLAIRKYLAKGFSLATAR